VRGDQPAHRAMRVAASEHVERPVAEFDDLIDRLRLRSIIRHLGEREVRILDARGRLRLAEMHDAIGFRVRQRPQEDAVDHAEDRGVGADAQTERQDEGERVPGHLENGAQGEADVGQHGSLTSAQAQSMPARSGANPAIVPNHARDGCSQPNSYCPDPRTFISVALSEATSLPSHQSSGNGGSNSLTSRKTIDGGGIPWIAIDIRRAAPAAKKTSNTQRSTVPYFRRSAAQTQSNTPYRVKATP